jgi:tetratricopeptide (TPR) repeat protein
MSSSLSIYNQGTSDDDTFVAHFVARHDLLQTLLRRLQTVDPEGNGSHYVLIGTRGMGKTSLLRRIAIAINRDADLAARYVPLTFREEQYNVLTLGDFWRNCGEALAEWAETTGRTDLAYRLDADLSTAIWADDEKATERFGEELVSLGRRPILLLDNIDLILDALSSDSNWALRRHLQARCGPIAIGAATHPLKQSADSNAAFYEFFEPVYLDALDERKTENCMRMLAHRREGGADRVIKVLNEQPERLRTLHTLSGGNPRILTLVYQLLEAGQSDAAMADLEILLDQVTPYYKAKIEEYQTPQQRAVVDAVALNWDPITTGDLARVTSIATTTLSPLLIRLRKDGLIENVETSGAYAGHQLVERFFNIWYLMRHGTRRAKQKMRWLVAFLTSFYSLTDLNDLIRRAEAGGVRRGWRNDYAIAFGEALERLSSRPEDNRGFPVSIQQMAAPVLMENVSLETQEIAEAIKLRQQISEYIQAADYERVIAASDEFLARYEDSENATLRAQIAIIYLRRAAAFTSMGEFGKVVASSDQFLKFSDTIDVKLLPTALAAALFGKGAALIMLDEDAAAISVYDEFLERFVGTMDLPLREIVANALIKKAEILHRAEDPRAGILIYDDIIGRFGSSSEDTLREAVAKALLAKGQLLREIDERVAAIVQFDEVVARFDGSQQRRFHRLISRALLGKAVTFAEMGDWEKAIKICDDILVRFDNVQESAWRHGVIQALGIKASALREIGEDMAGIAILDEILSRLSDTQNAEELRLVNLAIASKALAFSRMGNITAAIPIYEKILQPPHRNRALPPTSIGAWPYVDFANIRLDVQGEYALAETLYLEAASIDAPLADPHLAWLYLFTHRLPDAASIRKSLENLPAAFLGLLDGAIRLAEDNFGAATDCLKSVLDTGFGDNEPDYSISLIRFLRLAEMKEYGERLISWFEDTSVSDRLAPVYVAFKAYVRDKNVLLDVNPEVRRPAQIFYDKLDAPRRYKLNTAPKKKRATKRRTPK